ncbi:MAG: sulfotransferase family protein [Pseudomonas sp.]|uniref:sulfotransferase family protein n=1 Tax=Pseudomonas sp. TaxID=306 RepID=UPI003394D18A
MADTHEMDFTGWLPIRAWMEQGQWWIDWCWFGDTPLTQPFYRDSVQLALRKPFNQAMRRITPISALVDWQQRSPAAAPQAFIHHASRCGSTLMAQLLARLPTHRVLSEPPPLDALLRAHFFDPAASRWQPTWVTALLSAFGQSQQPLVIKLDAWNIFEADFLRQLYPATPSVFLYRHPLEIIVSQLRQPGAHMVPGMIGPSLLAFSLEEAASLSPLEFSARSLGKILHQGLQLCQARGALPVDYRELPQALWGRLAPLFAVPDSAHEQLRQTAHWDAKTPSMAFTPDSQRKRDAASPEVQAAVERWALEPYLALERLRLGA